MLVHIARRVLARIWFDGIFYITIFGGEMSKIGHGVGHRTVAIFGGWAMWLFLRLLANKKSLRAKNPTRRVGGYQNWVPAVIHFWFL